MLSMVLVGLLLNATAPAGELEITSRRWDMSAGLPAYVGRAVQDLERACGPPQGGPAEVVLVLGCGGDARGEGYRIQVDGPGREVRIDADGPQGLKYGVLELARHVRREGDRAFLPAGLQIQRRPAFATRGMYAHLHWAYARPYALRSWTMEDWQGYCDLLTRLGFNTLQIWPMMELLPHPLSAEDRAWLERFARIVDYAQRQRGLRVIIGSCPNNITEDARGVPIERRDYFDFEKRLDPGDPASLARILEARSDLYQRVPRADAYWVIDSDPGGWKGSPSSAFVDVLIGHRKLIDRYGRRPPEQPLVYWMWFGWGTGSREENWRTTLVEMKARLPEPWGLHACLPEHLAACRELGLLGKAIWFPYNLVEIEPSAPLTELRHERIDTSLALAAEAGLTGVQGNAQTPLAQLPNIAYLADRSWGLPAGSRTESLTRLARAILPERPELLVDGWASLAVPNASMARSHAARLRQAAERPSAGFLPAGWPERVTGDLATMLELHAAALEFETRANADDPQLAAVLAQYLQIAAGYLARTGYTKDRIVWHEAYREPVVRGLAALAGRMGQDQVNAQILQLAARRAVDHTGEANLVRLIIETLQGKRK